MTRKLRTALVVVREPYPWRTLETLFHASDYDVVVVASVANAVARVRQLSPELVMICVDTDDAVAFQLVSVLSVDCATSNIPVMTCVMSRQTHHIESELAELGGDTGAAAPVIAMMN